MSMEIFLRLPNNSLTFACSSLLSESSSAGLPDRSGSGAPEANHGRLRSGRRAGWGRSRIVEDVGNDAVGRNSFGAVRGRKAGSCMAKCEGGA